MNMWAGRGFTKLGELSHTKIGLYALFNITQCFQLGLVCGMGHLYNGTMCGKAEGV